MLFNVKEDTLDINGVRMDYVAFGSGKRTLVLIHGLTLRRVKGTGFGLAAMYRNFTREFRIYCFDRRRDIPEDYSVRMIGEDIAAAMDVLGLKNACVLGVSQGGMAAQYLAIERPDLVEGLALGVTLSRSNETLERVVAEWVQLMEENRLEEMVKSSFRYNYPAKRLKKYRLLMPLLAMAGKPKNPQEFLRMTTACLTCDTYDRLGEIKCPVLVLGDRQDMIVTGAASEEIAEKLGCRPVMFDGFGHGAYEEKHFNDEVYGFFTGELIHHAKE